MGLLSFSEVSVLLQKYRIPYCNQQLCATLDDALTFAKKAKFPLAMKVISQDIIHKSDAGGVVIGIANIGDLRNAYETMTLTLQKKFPAAKVEGILVQEMAEGTELIVGAKRDPTFGPVVLLGLGGIFVEVLKDVSFRVAPLTKTDAKAMIDELKAKKIFYGVRGKKPLNIDAVAAILASISDIMVKNNTIQEIDLNPVIADDKKAIAVDFRFIT
ncbi:acetyl-CoA synthetase [Candidatus Woesearchaeota archaeon]|nr:MAG: acetyl-CoA synthetase [Candidatus Woesearchaeota archaeon]